MTHCAFKVLDYICESLTTGNNGRQALIPFYRDAPFAVFVGATIEVSVSFPLPFLSSSHPTTAAVTVTVTAAAIATASLLKSRTTVEKRTLVPFATRK